MPQELLAFTPSYCVVGIYRLFADKNVRQPIWAKCKHGTVRGLIVGLVWASLTFRIQRFYVGYFMVNSPRVTGLSDDTLLGYKIPFTVTTYATVLFISSQMTSIIRFFLSRNLRLAQSRAWELTLKSRGKNEDFWGPYVEEWQVPPNVSPETHRSRWERWIGSSIVRIFVKKVILLPLHFVPFLGLVIGAVMKAIGTANALHKPYFTSKQMNALQISTFMEERKWHYRAFGFVAALLESIPFIGIIFTISNRIGACMWAFDLEKRQHMFRSGELQPIPPTIVTLPDGERVAKNPRGSGFSSLSGSFHERMSSAGSEGSEVEIKDEMAGSWTRKSL